MLRQFLDAKQGHPDCIVLFRMGDFYETFFDDARLVSEVLDLTLTARGKEHGDPIPMAGVPYHAAEGYIRRLVEQGHRVAICEQLEDPSQARGIVRRGVVRVITPGLVSDSGAIDAGANHFLVAVAQSSTAGDAIALCAVDITTGEFRVGEMVSREALALELFRLEPAEVLVLGEQRAQLASAFGNRPVTERGATSAQLETVLRNASSNPLATDERGQPAMSLATMELRRRIEPLDRAVLRDRATVEVAVSLVLDYLIGTQGGITPLLGSLNVVRGDEFLALDPDSAANLEVFETMMGSQRRGSLISVIDHTATAAGARRLRTWLAYPLRDAAMIRRRQDAVSELVDRPTLRSLIREQLRETRDIQRLASRIAAGPGNPRDLVAFATSLQRVPRLVDLLGESATPLLSELRDSLDACPDVVSDVLSTLVDEPPVLTNSGGMIREGVTPELDRLIELTTRGKEWLLRYEVTERDRTGISSLKVRHNSVFGYYIEVTRANLESVPENYIRKQTIANGERYFTSELKEFEDDLVTAETRRTSVELALYEALRARVCAQISVARATAEKLAEIDVLAGLAELSHKRGYCAPEVLDDAGIVIRDGRHPVVETMIEGERFVANDTDLDPERRLLVITGPNMAGKSTIIRQVALIVLLAQIGSHVPARSARIGVVDQIFSRVGASDNLSRGHSTFMVEMSETAHILRRASNRSLVILDEIGRGTATYDGLSIAWAVAEDLHDRIGAFTLFATHYHELTELARTRTGVRNHSVAVKEWNDNIVFLHRLVEGPANRSYGIQVARLAGVPDSVVVRAREVLSNLESAAYGSSEPTFARHSEEPESGATARPASPQLNLFGERVVAAPQASNPLVDELLAVRIDTTTPIEALNVLHKLQKRARRLASSRDA
jgi:DNA mismatch repair protein MutS